MKKISNPKLIRRNQQIGNYGQIGGMLILVGGFAASYFLPNQLELPYIALIAGFILVNIGASYNNHWGRVPPPDEAVDELLKGLDDHYTLIHFHLGADHALFTPNGIVAILAKYERGLITYDGKKWRQTGVSSLLKFFGTEALGNPVLDADAEAAALTKKLRKILQTDDVPPVRPVVVFVYEKTRVECDTAPLPVLHASKLKEYIRRLPKQPVLTPEQMRQVIEYAGGKK
ncbi:MAG TPA: NERD domain-containing protein [Anaerolineales bacterium]